MLRVLCFIFECKSELLSLPDNANNVVDIQEEESLERQ